MTRGRPVRARFTARLTPIARWCCVLFQRGRGRSSSTWPAGSYRTSALFRPSPSWRCRALCRTVSGSGWPGKSEKCGTRGTPHSHHRCNCRSPRNLRPPRRSRRDCRMTLAVFSFPGFCHNTVTTFSTNVDKVTEVQVFLPETSGFGQGVLPRFGEPEQPPQGR